jgi:hypothetical protein
MSSIVNLATDIAYRLPAKYYARAFKGKVSSYFFTEPNPWQGRFEGKSTHMLDAAFLFQNFEENLPVEAKKTARRLAEDFITFVHGQAGSAWAEGRTKVYGPEIEEGNKLENVDLDCLSAAWDMFVSGK